MIHGQPVSLKSCFFCLFVCFVFADYIELSIIDCKEYNQFDLGIDHLVMSMFEWSLVLLEEGIFYDHCVFLTKFY